jgi:8-oxo-dGTP pyrophosphatase MutT (NUDIX family)
MKYDKAGLIVLCGKGNPKVALVKGKFSQRWGFPKGNVEHGETYKNAAIREFKEETGYEVTELLQGLSLEVKGEPSKIFYLSITDVCFDMIPQESEISESKWLSLKDLCQDKMYTYETRLLYKILMGYSRLPKQIKIKKLIDYLMS